MNFLEEYVERRSWLSNQASQFRCPDSCPRYGCKDPELHVPVTLVDLVLQSAIRRSRPSEIYDSLYKIGWSPENEVPWVGRLTLELQKPCGFLEGKWCGIYPARPIGCAQFPEAWYLWGREETPTIDKSRFHHYPCLESPSRLSKEREKALAKLSEVAAHERWVSDFYLFGLSPFYVDLRNIVGTLMERARDLGMLRERTAPVFPHVISYPLIESFFQGKLGETGLLREISTKVVRLDSPEEQVSLLKLKEASDEIQKTLGSEEFVIYNQFEGKTLQTYRGLRPKPCRTGNAVVSTRGGNSVYSREEKGTEVRHPSSGSFYQERSQEKRSFSQHQPGGNQNRDGGGGSP